MARVLLVAPTCDGQDVGEAWVAHQWAHQLSLLHDVTLLTYRKRGRRPASEQLTGVRVVEWDEPPLLWRAERLNSLMKPGYLPFHARARRWVRQALARGERFDIAHQPLPVAMRYPSPLAGLPVPYVLGPVGGSLESPQGFRSEDDGSMPWYMRLRGLDRWRIEHDPVLRRTYAEAGCVLGIAEYVRDFLGPVALRRFEVLSETAIEALAPPVDRSLRGGTVRLLFVGRLVRTKGAREAVRAMGLLRDLDVRLDLVGDGFDRQACESLTAELGLRERVTFHGWQDRETVAGFYREADVFVFPSYREAGGNVAFEAMSHGLPLVVCDVGGPGAAVDETCGIRVSPRTPDQLAAEVAGGVRALVADRERRLRMGEAARLRVTQVGLWPAKARAVSELYTELAGASVPR